MPMTWCKILYTFIVLCFFVSCKTKEKIQQVTIKDLKELSTVQRKDELLIFDIRVSDADDTTTTNNDKKIHNQKTTTRRIKGTVQRCTLTRDTLKEQSTANHTTEQKKPQKKKSMNTLYITLSLALIAIIFVFLDYSRNNH